MAADTLEGNSLRQLEKEITCGICHEHYDEPKKLSCGHLFCKQCILELAQKDGVDKQFHCPECGEQVVLPGGSVDQLEDAQDTIKHSKLKFCEDEKTGILGKAVCGACTLGNKALAFCQRCSEVVCDVCIKAHRRMKAFASHQLVTLDELKGEEAERLLTKKSSVGSCPTHGNPQIAFCFDCSQLACSNCIVESHRGHKFVFNRSAPARSRQMLRKELERLKMVEEFMSKVQGNQELVEAQEDVWEDIHDSFAKLHNILETRKDELLEEARMIRQEKKGKLSGQEGKLSEACRGVRSLIREAEQCINDCTDEEVMSVHVDLLKRIESSVEEYSKPEWVHEPVEGDDVRVEITCTERLQQLCKDEVKIVYLQIDPSKSTILLEKPARVEWMSKVLLTIRLSNDRVARRACKIDCRLTSSSDGSNIDCHVERAVGGGNYYILFTPTTNKDHELTVQVEDKDIADSPFHLFVYVAPVPEDQEEPVEEQMVPMITSFEYNEEIKDADEPWLWEDHGLELLFQDDVPTDPVKRVEVSAAAAGDFVLPENTRLASVAFLVQCPFDLEREVQMRIPHFASDTSSDEHELSFVVSQSISPPFKFELLGGGDFTSSSEKGELKVKTFSWHAIVFVFKHGVSDLAYFLKNKYLVSLHRSSEFKFFEPNRYDWEVCFSVVKNVVTFQNFLKRFTRENDLSYCTESVMEFKKIDDLKIVSTTLPSEVKGWSLKSCEVVAIQKKDIDGYTAGTPPNAKFKLSLELGNDATHFRHEFKINGVHKQTQALEFELPKPRTAATGSRQGYDGPIASCLLDILQKGPPDLVMKYRRAVGKIPAHQRIFLDEDVDDRCSSRIAHQLSNWKDKPDLLLLTNGDVITLTEKHRGNLVQERMEALSMWRKRSSNNSFNMLLCKCIVGQWMDGTGVIIELVSSYEKTSVPPPPPPDPDPPSSSFSYSKIAVGITIVIAVVVTAIFAVRKFKN